MQVPDYARVGALALALTSGCSKAPRDTPSAAHDDQPAATAATPPRTTLLGNLGAFHRAIKTEHQDAQLFFDEGLTLLYGFNHEESFRSFARAAALDSASPMPHWGMALALGTNINDIAPAERLKTAHGHLAHAVARAQHGSAVERGHVQIVGEALCQRAHGVGIGLLPR